MKKKNDIKFASDRSAGQNLIPSFISGFTNFLLLFVFAMIVLLSNLIKYPDVTRGTALMNIIDDSGKIVEFRQKSDGNSIKISDESNTLIFTFTDSDTKNTSTLKGTAGRKYELPANNEIVTECRIIEGSIPGGKQTLWGELETRTDSRSLMERLINSYLNKYITEK